MNIIRSGLAKSMVALAAAVALAGTAQAVEVVQNSGQFDLAIAAFDPVGQSFVAPESQLQTIGFAFSDINPTLANDPITITLYQGAGFAGQVVASVVQTLPSVLPGTLAPPSIIDFNFSGTTLVTGQTYTAALTTTNSFKVAVVYSGVDAYAGGQAFITGSSASFVPGQSDLNFRVTALPVPEPSTYALTLAGLGMVAFVARRRRQT